MRYITKITILLSAISIGYVSAAPGGGFIAAAAVKPPITLDAGNVGVNFAGFHASAGLGGLLGGGATGGLHAEAGTPYGQSAGAGLGGVVAEGRAEGGLYAGADSGAGPAAGAAIGGATGASGAIGGSFSGATTGEAHISKTIHYESPVVVEETIHEAPKVQKTYVERTVIPNYVEKTIQVPTYVEKTVRVPTVVEKRIKVPAAPTIIEKTVSAPPESVAKVETSGEFAVGGGSYGGVAVVEKTRPVFRKHWSYRRRPAFGGFFAAGGIGGGAGSYTNYDYDAGYGAGYGTGYGTGYGSGYGGGSATYTVRKSYNPQVVNDIFNIPIATLGAVSKLVGGLAGGGSGSVSVSKHVSI